MHVYEGVNSAKLIIYAEPGGAVGFEILQDTSHKSVTLSRKEVRQLMDDLERFERFDKLERQIKENRK